MTIDFPMPSARKRTPRAAGLVRVVTSVATVCAETDGTRKLAATSAAASATAAFKQANCADFELIAASPSGPQLFRGLNRRHAVWPNGMFEPHCISQTSRYG